MIYFTAPIFLLLLSFTQRLKLLREYLAVFLCFFIFGGKYYNGADFINYLAVFNDVQYSLSELPYHLLDVFEPGFLLLQALSKSVINHVQFFYIVIAILNLSLLLSFLKKTSVNIPFTLFLFYCNFGWLLWLELTRQGIAVSITITALPYLVQRKIIPFFIIVATFHYSALIFLPLYWVLQIDFSSNRKILLSLLIAFSLFLLLNLFRTDVYKFILFALPDNIIFLKKLRAYFMENASIQSAPFSVFMKYLAYTPILYFLKKFPIAQITPAKEQAKFYIRKNMLFLYLLSYPILAQIAILTRFLPYLGVALPIIGGYVFQAGWREHKVFLVYLIGVSLMLLVALPLLNHAVRPLYIPFNNFFISLLSDEVPLQKKQMQVSLAPPSTLEKLLFVSPTIKTACTTTKPTS